jgi:hypothetical protein
MLGRNANRCEKSEPLARILTTFGLQDPPTLRAILPHFAGELQVDVCAHMAWARRSGRDSRIWDARCLTGRVVVVENRALRPCRPKDHRSPAGT